MKIRPLRRDAQRNREKLLETTRKVFARDGLMAPLEEIARQAEVSIGTLYNHFPNREALFDAVYPDRIATLDQAIEDALANPDPWAGFVSYVERFFELQAEDRGLNQAMSRYTDAEELQKACEQGFNNVSRVIRRAQRAGVLRKDFRKQDFAWLVWANSKILEATSEVAPDAWRRSLSFALDGLRTEAAHRIGVRAMTDEEIAAAMRRI